MDAAEYKHVVLGLIFLKYISDGFHDRYRQLVAEAVGVPVLDYVPAIAQPLAGRQD